MMEIGKRYIEQLQTTVETMRRRLVATYDLSMTVGQRFVKTVDRVHEAAELTALDFCEQIVQACSNKEPLDAQDRETRNNLVELYLAISVLLLGASAGQLSGSSILGLLLAQVFDSLLELLLVFMLPIYVYLNFRKNAALDETERRVWLFGLAFAQGALLGHLVGARLIHAFPAVFFLLPLVFALLTDYEISPANLYSNRNVLFGACTLFGGGLTLTTAAATFGLGVSTIMLTVAHLAILFVHFQVVIMCMRNKSYGVSEAQLAYILSLVLAELVVSYVFISGDDPHS